MDGNFGYYYGDHYQHLKGNLGLQLMSPVPPDRESSKPLLTNGAFFNYDSTLPVSSMPADFVRSGWLNYRDNKMGHMMPFGHGYLIPETHDGHGVQMIQHLGAAVPKIKVENEPESSKEVELYKSCSTLGRNNKTASDVSPKRKKPRKVPVERDGQGKSLNKCTDILINGINFDISKLPPPVCSCTGVPQQCYRWGLGGWQSACCTTNMSMYPLPMSTKRRGARIAGRKMSQGAFKKVLEKFAGEGYELSNPIDLRTYWAKHGTNKFVTIR